MRSYIDKEYNMYTVCFPLYPVDTLVGPIQNEYQNLWWYFPKKCSSLGLKKEGMSKYESDIL